MKRFCEEENWKSDVEELIDVGKQENYCQVSSSISATATPHVLARKKRRGIIEKRRRDRINNSLSELRRLVPTAFEKQGNSKPEKAEILQMTVEHLKLLHATGGKGYPEPGLLAVDYRSVGFRECLAEVMTYLGSLDQREGSHGSDPLKDRLVSHLTSYVSDTEPTPAPDWAWAWAWPWPCRPLTALLPRAWEVARSPRGELAHRDRLPASARGRPSPSPAESSPRRAWPGLTSAFPGVRSNAASFPGLTACLGMNSPSPCPPSRLHAVRTAAPAGPLSLGPFQPTSPFRLRAFEQTRRSPGARKTNRSWTTEIGAF